jgi:hypothetical protein
MKAYETVEIWFYAFLTSVEDGGEQQLHGPAASILGKRGFAVLIEWTPQLVETV